MRLMGIEKTVDGYKITLFSNEIKADQLYPGMPGRSYVWDGSNWARVPYGVAYGHAKVYPTRNKAEKALENIKYKELMTTLASLGD